MNTYTRGVLQELERIHDFSQVREIRATPLIGCCTPRLELGESLLKRLKSVWVKNGVAENGIRKTYISTVILTYAQHRQAFRTKFGL